MNNIAKDNKKYFFAGGIVVLAVISIVGYSQGYRLKSNLTIGRLGRLEISVPLSGTSIFIDETKKIVTSKDNEKIELPLSPKVHSIIVSREGYFPWTKKINIESSKKIEVSPILISSNATGQIITKNDSSYYRIRNSIITDKHPTKENPIVSKDGGANLWIEDNAIMVEIGSTTKKVIQPDTIIRNVSFYKDRSDVVMFSNQVSIYAIETDTTSTQNFMPIYRGQNPRFILADDSSIYVLDGEILMQILI